MEAGDGAIQVHTDRGTVHLTGTILSVAEIRQIALDAAKTVLLESWPIAEQLIAHRAEQITDIVIERMGAKDRSLFQRFQDPRFLAPLVSVQRSFAETGDRDLGSLLAGLLADLAAEPIRSRRDIVLREAIDCAPRLAAQHLNALTVIVMLKNMRYRWAPDVDILLEGLDRDLRPYYGAIPTDSFEYNYLGATAAGSYLPGLGATAYNTIFNGHANAMYRPFPPDEIPKEWTPDEEKGKELAAMLWLQRTEPIENSRVKLAPDAADVILSSDYDTEAKLTDMQKNLRNFVKPRSISAEDFKAAVEGKCPELADFFKIVDSTMALHFQPSPVGQMLARHEIATRSPKSAAEMDKLFAQPNHVAE